MGLLFECEFGEDDELSDEPYHDLIVLDGLNADLEL